MKKKNEKLPALSSEHRESLASLGSRPEFQALEKLFGIEENNIIILGFKINSSDPSIALKKAHLEGRMYELRKILKTFEEVSKKKEKDG